MSNALDVDLHDHEQDDEIELLGELMVLASASDEPLDVCTVDALLGIGVAAGTRVCARPVG